MNVEVRVSEGTNLSSASADLYERVGYAVEVAHNVKIGTELNSWVQVSYVEIVDWVENPSLVTEDHYYVSVECEGSPSCAIAREDGKLVLWD